MARRRREGIPNNLPHLFAVAQVGDDSSVSRWLERGSISFLPLALLLRDRHKRFRWKGTGTVYRLKSFSRIR